MIKNRRTDLMQALKRSANPKVIWGAGHVGVQIYTACQQAGIEIAAFCDRDPEIIGKTIFGIKILPTDDIPTLYPHAEMVLSMNRIAEAVDELKSFNLAQWYAGGLLFDLNEVLQNPPNAYAVPDDHYALQICSIVHNNYVEEEVCLLGSLDCVITERCSLKCRECSNLMQYYAHPIDYDIQQVIVELQALMQYVDRLFELRLIGGDVFMHRHWDIILQFALSEPKIDRVTFYTNGTLIPRSEKLSLLSNERVMLQISNYGKRSHNLAKLIEQCKKNRIWYRATPIDMWNACSTISRHYRSSDENDRLFHACCLTDVTTLQRGKVFRCPYAANAFQLGAVEDNPLDYIDVMDKALSTDTKNARKQFRNYLTSQSAIHICDYCAGRVPGINEIPPNEQTKKPLPYMRIRK
jgi:hypothetical protein